MPSVGWIGRIGAPVIAVVTYYALGAGADGLSDAGRATAAIGILMAVLWLTEALPLPATALLPIVLFPLFGVLSIREAAAPYAREYIFLFMGGFMIALAMERWGLHRRIALLTVSAVGTRPTRLVGGFMLATAGLSMWISNSAATLLMLPIGMSLIRLISDGVHSQQPQGGHSASDGPDALHPSVANFATCMMLGTAYAANVGGMGTLVGTPPNLVLVAFLKDTYNIEIGFGRWMVIGLPLVAVFLFCTWIVLVRIAFPIRLSEIPGGRQLIRGELDKLGRTTRGEWTVLVVFLLTAAAWITREPLSNWDWFAEQVPVITRVHDAGIAMAAALALFAIPVHARRGVFALDWETAAKLPWGVLILFGGGLSLAAAVSASGLDAWIGQQVTAFRHWPLVALIALTTTMILLMTELSSNVATASAMFPILGGVAIGIGIDPARLIIPAGLAASCAFMMPVATPPNAIVFGSGYVKIRQMVKAGIWLNVIGLVLIVALAHWTSTWVVSARP